MQRADEVKSNNSKADAHFNVDKMVNKHNKKQEKRRGQEKWWFLSLIKFVTLFLIIYRKNGRVYFSRNRKQSWYRHISIK